MSLNTILDIAATGMVAQTKRLEVATDNLVNADSVARTRAEAYHARRVVFQSVLSSETPSTIDANAGINSDLQTPTSPGVAVAEIVQNDAPIQKKYDPSNPKANSEGYVYVSNVDKTAELINSTQASQAYRNDVAIMTSTKQLILQVLKAMQT